MDLQSLPAHPRPVAALFACILLGLVLAGGCAAPELPAPADDESNDITLTVVGFTAGSSTQLRADAIAAAVRLEQPAWNVASMAAGGEARLVSKRLAGEADLYFQTAPRAVELAVQVPLHPDVDFGALTDYRLVMPSGMLWLHLLVSDDTGFDDPSDLALQHTPYVAGCGAGNMTLVFSKLLEHYGSSLEELQARGSKLEAILVSSPEGVEALQSGRIDVGLNWSGIPSSQFLAITSGVSLLPVEEPGLVDMFADLGCIPAVIPAGTYPFVTFDTATVAAPQSLVARTGLADEVVYSVVEAVFEHPELIATAYGPGARFLTPEAVADAVALSEQTGELFHPGALRYYRERGWIS